MNKPAVTIIIPCYNCERTLEQAFDSCFSQNIAGPFEVVMVDDYSTDGTRELMKRLVKTKPNARIFFHERNKGGGATRNTATRHAQSDVIFCLDSDDVLPEGTVGKMLALLKEKKVDAVGIHRSIKFKGDDTNNVSHVNTFGYAGQKIPFDALMEKPEGPFCPLYSTFMYTKKAFEIAGGYPEDHGFDTQSFAWKFLANGLTAYTCPDAEYLHRIHFNRSYYVREYESGKINHNWFKIFEEFLFLFNEKTQREILSLDLNNPNESIFNKINSESDIFKSNLDELIVHRSEQAYELRMTKEKDPLTGDLYWLGARKFHQGKYAEAFDIFERLIRNGLRNGYAHDYLKRSALGLGKASSLVNEELIKQAFSYKKQGAAVNIFVRIYRKARKELKKLVKRSARTQKAYYFFLGIEDGIKKYLTEKKRLNEYRAEIEEIKKKKEIVVELDWGGLGDALVYTHLPRALKEAYGIDFYLSETSRNVFRNADILKLCFEMNPYFKGFKAGKAFKHRTFSRDRKLFDALLDRNGMDIAKSLARQFGLGGESLPEIYYQPKKLPEYADATLVDINFISGQKLGWVYDTKRIEAFAQKEAGANGSMIYIDPKKQNLFAYADMINSCKRFITVLSGGAALAAALRKKHATVFLPKNVRGGSVYAFTFTDSDITYLS